MSKLLVVGAAATVALSACPFCGSEHVDVVQPSHATSDGLCCGVCYRCFAFGPTVAGTKAAGEAWNKRKEPTAETP
jgi:hypothetical protein